MQSWFPPYALSLNGPGWSISVEAFFYLTFPFILFGIKKSNISWKILLLVSFLLYFFTQASLSNLLGNGFYKGFPSPSHDLIYYYPLSHYCSFLLGISGGYIYIKHPQWFNKRGFLSFIILISAIAINYFALQNPSITRNIIGYPLAFGSSFYSLLFLLLILSLVHSKNFITIMMSSPFFVLLGEASYSLYILQIPIRYIYTNYILKYLMISDPNVNFFVFVLLLICFSIASYHFIEKPGKRKILDLYAYTKNLSNERNSLRSIKTI